MWKYLLGAALVIGGAAAFAQPVTNPAPVGAAGAYNSGAPTCTDGQFCWLQTDVNGNLKTTATFSPSGTQNVNITQVLGAAPSATNPLWVAPATAAIPWLIGGDVASAATDSGNPVKIGAVYSSTLPTFTNGQRGNLQMGTRGALNVSLFAADSTGTVSISAPSDGASVGTAMWAYSLGRLFNGTNYDRARSIIAGQDTTGTGIAAAGILAQFDNTAPSSVTENQFAPVRMNGVRALYTEPGPFTYGRATADTQIKASAGFIHTISVAGLTATPTAGLMTVYDNTAESGTVIYAEWVFATVVGHTITLNVPTTTGIYVGFDAALANVQVTVAYR